MFVLGNILGSAIITLSKTWPLPSSYHHHLWCLSYTFDSCNTDHSNTLFEGLVQLQTLAIHHTGIF